jgi:hypothetical protein
MWSSPFVAAKWSSNCQTTAKRLPGLKWKQNLTEWPDFRKGTQAEREIQAWRQALTGNSFRPLRTRAMVCTSGSGAGCVVAFENLRDESLLCFYDNIRIQVEADRGSKHKFLTGPSVKQHASALREEMIKRRLQHTAIDWDRD